MIVVGDDDEGSAVCARVRFQVLNFWFEKKRRKEENIERGKCTRKMKKKAGHQAE